MAIFQQTLIQIMIFKMCIFACIYTFYEEPEYSQTKSRILERDGQTDGQNHRNMLPWPPLLSSGVIGDLCRYSDFARPRVRYPQEEFDQRQSFRLDLFENRPKTPPPLPKPRDRGAPFIPREDYE